jgi:ArsR family transcriptional regulator
MENKYQINARVFRAFCDENRLMILELLQKGEKCACILLDNLNIGQSTLSHHMKILVDSGVVLARKDGKWTYYSISLEGSNFAKELLEKLTKINIESEDKIKCKQHLTF